MTNPTHADEFFGEPTDPFAQPMSLDEALSKREEAVKKTETPEEEEKNKYAPYSKELLLALYDDLVFENGYKEEVKVRGFSFGFKTRSSEDLIGINRALDNFKAQSANSYQTYANYLTLAASLSFIDGVEFEAGNLKLAYDALLKQTTAKVDIMLMELTTFDRKVAMAIEVGRKNF